jgi:hypothetical protein
MNARETPYLHEVEIPGDYVLEISGTVGNAHAGTTCHRRVTEKN